MSQHLHLRDGPLGEQSSLQESPGIGRKQHLHSTAGTQSPLLDISNYRSPRKPAPSPLQTSTTARTPSPTPTKTIFEIPASDLGSRIVEGALHSSPKPNEPRSPKERLDDLLATEKSFYIPEKPVGKLANGTDSRAERPPNALNVPLRSVSDPIPTESLGGGPTSGARFLMATAAPSNRIEMARGPPRTSSIDSAISSISVGKHSHNSSQDSQVNSRGAADIANLIHTAGSAEAVIQHLLKEKQSQAAQNSQLWRLVDKQRAMILGLNRDLERALKDKERYRKKLKESLGQLSAPPNEAKTSGPASETSSPNSRTVEKKKDENDEALVPAGPRHQKAAQEEIPSSPIDVALAPYPITPPANHATNSQSLTNLVEAEHKMPIPLEHAFSQYNVDAPTGSRTAQQQRKAVEVARELPHNAPIPPSKTLPVNPPRIATSNDQKLKQSPTLAIIEASPNVDQGEPKFPLPPRKPPPAPLKLGKTTTSTSSHLHQADSADSGESDYDDILEVEEIPTVTERGRRRTREEDDRERKIAAAKDAELRSLSKKSKSRPTTPKETKEKIPVPPIVRQTVQISPPDAHLQVMSPTNSLAGSLAGILNASESDRGSDGGSQRGISPPTLSPGLPISPRPIDRGIDSSLSRNLHDGSGHSSLASPPMSPRGMGAFPSAVPLSPRAPRQPIPLPPNTPMSLASPGMPKIQYLELASPKPLHSTRKPSVNDNESPKDSNSSVPDRHAIYQGYVTDEYPDLLLPPNALPSVDVRVASSRLKPSRASLMFPMKLDDDPVFTLAVFARTDDRELWRVEKDSLSLAQLDQQLKQTEAFVAKIPEKSLFSGHAPAKMDARRVALDKYFDEVLNTQLDTKAALAVCKYLSTNTMEPNAEDSAVSGDSARNSPTGPGGRPMRSGYLTKRGKNFGGWKARFFVLDGPILKYYEAPGGAHLGAIKLQNAQIGKQQQHSENQSPARGDTDDIENQYRHAFLILEPKRKDSSSLVRHVLCAESDKERDQWVEALLRYVDYRDSEDEDPGHRAHARNGSDDSRHVAGPNAKKKTYGQGRVLNVSTPDADDSLRGISYEETAQAETPGGIKQRAKSGTPPPTNEHDREPTIQSFAISGPKNATIIHDTGAWGNKQSSLMPLPDDKIKQKKRSFFGFGPKPRGSGDVQDNSNDSSTNLLSQMSYEQHGPIRAVFGAPLAEAVRYNHPVDADIELPAVVYRCIEYLDARNAAAEEGIFRLSGSNVVIKSLRERFNVEGDVNLITDDQYYDIHAVASLLKLYLRELPTTILTRELHLDFLAVTELHDLQEKISALNGLVHRLPRANGALLRYLSGFLINIINHSDINKMTVRNVGIVFSPTLNIPAPVFALFLQQYDGIFGSEPDQHDRAPIEVTVTAPPLTPDDIRSPRKQHFQELPTPSYDQQTFPRTPVPFPHPSQHNQQRALLDTGFTPLQPTYENTTQQATMGGPEYGSRAPTLAGPSYEQYLGGNVAYRQHNGEQASTSSRAKKRESSMFSLTMGPKKPNFGKVKEESHLVDEESFFD